MITAGFWCSGQSPWRITLPTAPRLVPIVKCVGAGVAEMSAIPRAANQRLPPLQTELDALNATFSTSGYRFKRWASGIFGQSACTLQTRAVELRGQIRLAQARRDECRCLTCGSADTLPFKFDDDGVCSGFQHECGGRLLLGPPDMDAPRFNYRRETIHLDETGKRIPEDDQDSSSPPWYR